MRTEASLALAALVLLAGCSGIVGGPELVEEECVEVPNALTTCTAVVENPEEEPMCVKVTATVSGRSDSETVDLAPGERKNVSLAVNIVGDTYYDIEVEGVSS